MSTAFRYQETGCSVCGWRCNTPPISGSFEQDPRLLRTERRGWLNNLIGKRTVPPTLFRKVEKLFGRGRWAACDLGLCKNDLKAKIAVSETCGFVRFFHKKLYIDKEPRSGTPLRLFSLKTHARHVV
jgi:hypothetical protein